MSVVPVPVPSVRSVALRPISRLPLARRRRRTEVIRIVGWPDPVIDRLGYDPRSLYVETFWLGILGPTCTWLMRRLAAGLDDRPDGFDLDVDDTARALGLGSRSGRQSPFRRALARCVTFQVARRQGPMTLAVRRRLPPLPRRHLLRLPTSLQESHATWMVPVKSSPVLEEARRNARRLALGLLASGKERPEVELQLVRWQVHPAIAHEATQWAWAFRAHEANGADDGPWRPTGRVRERPRCGWCAGAAGHARWARWPRVWPRYARWTGRLTRWSSALPLEPRGSSPRRMSETMRSRDGPTL